MKKRLIALILALSVLCVLFAACGTDKESNVTTVSDTAAGNNTEAGTQTSGIQKVTLSGNPEDTFVAEKDCYAEGEAVVVYFQKGVTVRGDMLAIVEKAMSDIEECTGLNFKRNWEYDCFFEYRDSYLTEDFSKVNPRAEKINVIIFYDPVSLEGAHAYEEGAVYNQCDFDDGDYQIVYHELTHVNHLRNYVSLNRVMDEGFAEYFSYLTRKQQNLPAWTQLQYFEPYDYDTTPITQGREGFTGVFPKKADNYHYGFRFVMFLECTYGEGTFRRLAKVAGEKGFDSSYDYENKEESIQYDNDMLEEIIVTELGEDVFDRFAKWNETEFPKKIQEYKDYMNSIGQTIDW